MKTFSPVFPVLLAVLLLAEGSFASTSSRPKIDEKVIAGDLMGRVVDGWTFHEDAPRRIKILEVKHGEDKTILDVLIRTIDARGRSGREGKLRLEYEYADSTWRMLDIRPISFLKLESRSAANLKNIMGFPLLLAADEGDVDLVRRLIGEGVDVNQPDKDSRTALMLAAGRGHVDVARTLLAAGADVNALDMKGDTSLNYAVVANKINVAKVLLRNGADINGKGAGGWPPLSVAAAHGRNTMVELLLANGADVNAKNHFADGSTALMDAVRWLQDKRAVSSRILIVKALLANGADVNAMDAGGYTALWHALIQRSFGDVSMAGIAKVLLDAGADVRTRQSGKTPLMFAKEQGLADMIMVLEKAGAQE